MSIKTTIVHMPSGKWRLETRQGAWPINRNWNGFNTWPEYDHKPTKEEVDVFARELFKPCSVWSRYSLVWKMTNTNTIHVPVFDG